ncbi:hypothetical protein [Endozoicomonas ascidiicola]|uniref:hypothetical protein n=1 Tax=Endozoicomonas ascidiicola TaxID=1698521 RepID=UPI00082C1504|nr:hypothetical protein [Endozoicomonas ascidiicola]
MLTSQNLTPSAPLHNTTHNDSYHGEQKITFSNGHRLIVAAKMTKALLVSNLRDGCAICLEPLLQSLSIIERRASVGHSSAYTSSIPSNHDMVMEQDEPETFDNQPFDRNHESTAIGEDTDLTAFTLSKINGVIGKLRCNHLFHRKCLKNLFELGTPSSPCPTCRMQFVKEDINLGKGLPEGFQNADDVYRSFNKICLHKSCYWDFSSLNETTSKQLLCPFPANSISTYMDDFFARNQQKLTTWLTQAINGKDGNLIEATSLDKLNNSQHIIQISAATNHDMNQPGLLIRYRIGNNQYMAWTSKSLINTSKSPEICFNNFMRSLRISFMFNYLHNCHPNLFNQQSGTFIKTLLIIVQPNAPAKFHIVIMQGGYSTSIDADNIFDTKEKRVFFDKLKQQLEDNAFSYRKLFSDQNPQSQPSGSTIQSDSVDSFEETEAATPLNGNITPQEPIDLSSIMF